MKIKACNAAAASSDHALSSAPLDTASPSTTAVAAADAVAVVCAVADSAPYDVQTAAATANQGRWMASSRTLSNRSKLNSANKISQEEEE